MAQAPSSDFLLPSLFLFLVFFLDLAQSQSCYWPDGSDAGSSYAPCPSANGTGGCCYSSGPSLSDLCYSNGFCYSIVLGKIYRGACTDQSWSAGAGCAAQCLNTNLGDTIDVSPCLDTMNCCGAGDNVTSCCAGGDGFAWDNATFLTQEAASTTIAATGMTTTTMTVLVAATAAGQASASPSVGVACHNQSVALGAGLGVPLGLAVLAAAFFAYRAFVLRRTMKDQNTAVGSVQSEKAGYRDKKTRPQELGDHEINELPGSAVSQHA